MNGRSSCVDFNLVPTAQLATEEAGTRIQTAVDVLAVVFASQCHVGIVDPLSLKLAKAGDGLYFHIAVEGGKQTTETIPPSRIFETIGKFVKRKATRIVIL